VSAIADGETPLVFVTVGTDHHRFDRLVDWVDRWIVAHDGSPVEFLVQTGTSIRPRYAQSTDYLAYADMEATMRRAAAVVSHGGPGSIMLSCYCGKKPTVVPRSSALGEHVDNHQLVFTRRLAAEGEILLAESEDEFGRLLDEALAGGATDGAMDGSAQVAQSVRAFQRLVGDLMSPSG